jgi:hypothetical protein
VFAHSIADPVSTGRSPRAPQLDCGTLVCEGHDNSDCFRLLFFVFLLILRFLLFLLLLLPLLLSSPPLNYSYLIPLLCPLLGVQDVLRHQPSILRDNAGRGATRREERVPV